MDTRIKVIFRADGNSQIGLGHLYRSLAMAEHLGNDYEICFLVREDTTSGNLSLFKQYSSILIPTNILLKNEPDYIEEQFNCLNSILVLDSYQFNNAYLQTLKNNKFITVYIDDKIELNFCSDAIINHSGGILAEEYQKDQSTQLYLGPDYAILREAFFKARASNENKTMDVLVCFGGADSDNYTYQTIQRIPCHYKIGVVIGAGYKYKEMLLEYARQNLNIKIFFDLGSEELSLVMAQSSCAITSPSTISYEYLAASNGQLFLIKTAENQARIYKFLTDNYHAKAFEGVIILNERQTKPIDGKSPTRIRSIFNNLARKLYEDIPKNI